MKQYRHRSPRALPAEGTKVITSRASCTAASTPTVIGRSGRKCGGHSESPLEAGRRECEGRSLVVTNAARVSQWVPSNGNWDVRGRRGL